MYIVYHLYFSMSINWSIIFILAILLVNVYIVKSEYKYKKIPNQLLLLLLWFNIWYILTSVTEFHLESSLIKLWILLFWVVILYFFKIWNPSYLKYIFVSSIFFLWVWEISYISNIFFIILLYIVLYFFYYYLDILISMKKIKSHIRAIKAKTIWDFKWWFDENKKNLALKIIIIIFWFFATFVLIRLIRLYIQWEVSGLYFVYQIDNITINTVIFIFIWLFLVTALLQRFYQKYLLTNYKMLILLVLVTISFLVYEFMYDYEFISKYLHKIFTFLIFLFLLVMIVVRMWKYLFFDNDSKIIRYTQLKEWNIIDKKIISTYLVWQQSLKEINVAAIIKNIKNPIDTEGCEEIKKLIKQNDNFLKKEWLDSPPNIIRIYNQFLFTPFIFWSFLITLLFKKNMLTFMIFEVFKWVMSFWG